MNGPVSLFDTIRAALRPHGLFMRGSLAFEADGPEITGGRRAKAVILVGNIGGSLWPAFSRWREGEGAGAGDPLDTWSKGIILPLAEEVDSTAFFPSDPPWQPFQQWAMRAEGLKPSPLGILIHPEYGLWHGYRGALAFAERPDGFIETAGSGEDPCMACAAKPCLTACPVGAILPEGFQYVACRTFLGKPEAACLDKGCLARNACPVGQEFRYPPQQLAFHMAALKRL